MFVCIEEWFSTLDDFFRSFDNIGTIINDALMRIIPALICITIHELAHGYTAYKLGDNTAKNMGRLTLNPIKHIDPIGLLMMLVMRFGWAKPVPVDSRNFKHPKWYMAITALAGPLSNIILAAFIMMLFGMTFVSLTGFEAGLTIANIIFNTIYISIALAVFNMLPLPPLDGSKVLFSLLPENAYSKLMHYERYGMIILLIIVGMQMFFNINIFGMLIGYPTELIFSGLGIFFDFTFNLVN